jgi:acetoacetyl-CoA synthetase
VVEAVPGVVDSLVVHLEATEASDPGELVLFVALDTSHLVVPVGEIRTAVRHELSPRHVPDEVHAVESIPTTLSGKKLELPVKRILAGAAPDDVASRDALKNPDSLDAIAEIARLRR